MLRSVEVDGPAFLCCGRADAQVAGRKLAGEPIQLGFAKFDVELQFLHEPSPRQMRLFPVSRRGIQLHRISAREDYCDKHMTACFSAPARQGF